MGVTDFTTPHLLTRAWHWECQQGHSTLVRNPLKTYYVPDDSMAFGQYTHGHLFVPRALPLRLSRPSGFLGSGNQVTDDLSVKIRQSPLNAIVIGRQPFVIDAQQVRDRGMHIIGGNWVLDR
jgi:hypothetical protein